MFKQLSRFGYRQVEFAGYGQHANAPGGADLGTVQGAKLLRSWLDEYGLRAQGSHGYIPPSWPLTSSDRDTFKRWLEIANILGMEHMGTGADPTNTPTGPTGTSPRRSGTPWAPSPAARASSSTPTTTTRPTTSCSTAARSTHRGGPPAAPESASWSTS